MHALYIYYYCVVRIVYGANKSENHWGSFDARGGVVSPSVFNQLLKCADQIYILRYFAAYSYQI